MSDANNTGMPRTVGQRRWLGPAFLASLVINLFLVGLIASAIWMHREPPRSHGGVMPFFLGGDRSDLSKEDRSAMRQMMRGQFKTVLPYLMEMDKSRADLAKVIGETPYDPIKVGEAFARVEQAQIEIGQTMREAMIKGFGEMSDAQRQRLAKVMEENAEHRWDRRKERHRERDDDDNNNGDNGSDDGPDGPPAP